MKDYRNLLHIMSQVSTDFIESDEDIKEQIVTLIKFYPEVIREAKKEYKKACSDNNWSWLYANEITNFLYFDEGNDEEFIHNTFKENVLYLIESIFHKSRLVDFELKNDKTNPYYLRINKGPSNVFTINEIENENDNKFSKGNWIFILFNQKQRSIVFNVLDLVSYYPSLNFAFKPFLENSQISSFSNIIKDNKSSVIIFKNIEGSVLLGTETIKKDKLKELFDKEYLFDSCYNSIEKNKCLEEKKSSLNKKMSAKVNILLRNNPNENHYFTLNIENASKNVFAITHIESENDDMFKEGNWLFILFAGYSGSDIKFVKELVKITTDYPKLNFAFKPYMDDDKMQDFAIVNIEKKRTPVLIHKMNSNSKLLSDTTKDIEKIKIALNSIE